MRNDKGYGGNGDQAVGGVFYRMYLQSYVDGLAGIGGGVGEVVTMETDGVGGELDHRALPRDVGSDGGCADGNHGGEDLPVAEERVGSDHGLSDYSGRGVSRGHGVLLLATRKGEKC